jgi:hypothetical protein
MDCGLSAQHAGPQLGRLGLGTWESSDLTLRNLRIGTWILLLGSAAT